MTAAAVTLVWRLREPVVTYSAQDNTATQVDAVAAGPRSAILHFSDGTECVFAPEARGRVLARTRTGARLGLDEGRVHLNVRHLPEAHWAVEAGPFTVDVTGTLFDVAWEPEAQNFEVRLYGGSVAVTGMQDH